MDGIKTLAEHRMECKDRLIELLGIDSMEKCEHKLQIIKQETLNGNDHIHFVVQTEKGYFVNCHLLLPKNRQGVLPLCTCLEGHVSGAHLALGVEKFPYDDVYISHIAKYFDMGDLAILIASKKLLIFSTTNDEWFPLKGAEKAYGEIERIYKALGAVDKCKMLVAEGSHRFFAHIAWDEMLKLTK